MVQCRSVYVAMTVAIPLLRDQNIARTESSPLNHKTTSPSSLTIIKFPSHHFTSPSFTKLASLTPNKLNKPPLLTPLQRARGS